MLGGIGGRRRRGQQRMRWLDGNTDSWTWVWVNSGSWWWTGRPGVLWFIGLQRVGHDWETELHCTECNTRIWKINHELHVAFLSIPLQRHQPLPGFFQEQSRLQILSWILPHVNFQVYHQVFSPLFQSSFSLTPCILPPTLAGRNKQAETGSGEQNLEVREEEKNYQRNIKFKKNF